MYILVDFKSLVILIFILNKCILIFILKCISYYNIIYKVYKITFMNGKENTYSSKVVHDLISQ